jgi:hypothetical protein
MILLKIASIWLAASGAAGVVYCVGYTMGRQKRLTDMERMFGLWRGKNGEITHAHD